MKTIQDVEQAVTVAMKSGDKARLDSLRGLLNQIKLIAKNDGNREVKPEDVITAANRVIKQNRETISFIPEGDDRRAPLESEITTVQEFLPQQMTRDELDALIGKLVEEGLANGNPKAVRGYVMKSLNTNHRGQFDAQEANTLLMARV